ncbi:tetratricopeptide repeat protein [Desulfurispirillum indicum]|uniref:Uncharacterized protein n=1 Tax=Desulfurispirillum indicum (strain ATCC BAA-1389 / DSM 22839 / S5) TaxID=653733 RepID=E6W2Z3_DESIS|nr:tetratricopeptide repeat protein [Desulfurispirillum indicum]ADU66818.1 hypothetical protein Selin_2098 [Desulfurispirillum indicum S5]UCZ56137.1 tetratricopeptide repeat protein [Desulfurispirillum indicum]
MYTIAIMIICWLAIGAGLNFFMPLWLASILSIVITAIIMYFLGKKFMTFLTKPFEESQKALQKGNYARAIRILEDGKRLKNWQLHLDKQMNSQIGVIYYLQKEYEKAKEYLNKGIPRHWIGVAMLAVIYFREKNYTAMKNVFNRAVKSNPKHPIIWAVYAWCLVEIGEREAAIEILSKGNKKNPTSEALEQNLAALQNGRKMKMKAFGENWYQFMLELPTGPAMTRHQKGFQGRPSAAQLRAAQRMVKREN